MNCQNCGQLLPTNASFCSNCGALLDSGVTATPQTITPPVDLDTISTVPTEIVKPPEPITPPIESNFPVYNEVLLEDAQFPPAENTIPPAPVTAPPFFSQPVESNPPVYTGVAMDESQFDYSQQPLQQAGFITEPQQPMPKKNSMVLFLIIAITLVVLLLGAISFFLVSNFSGGTSSQKLDRNTNVLLLKDTRGRYYTVHSDGTSEQLDLTKDSVYFLANKDDRMYAPSGMGSSDDGTKKLFFSSDFSDYYASNNPKDIRSDLVLLDKKTYELLSEATYCFGSSNLDTIYYVAGTAEKSVLYVYYTKTGESVELDRSRNVQNLSLYDSACSPDGKIFMYVLGNPDGNKETIAYKIVNGGEPVEMGKNIYPIVVSNNQGNFIYYERDSKGRSQLFHETGGEKTTIAKRISESYYDSLLFISNRAATELIYEDNGRMYYYKTGEKPVYAFDRLDFALSNDTYFPLYSTTSFSNDSLREIVFVDIYDENFYYFNKEGKVEKESYMGRILFSDNTVYYTNSSNTLYKLSLETGEPERLARNVLFFNVSIQSDTVVYSTDNEDMHAIVRGKEFSWDDYTAQWTDVSDNGKYIYFVDYDESEIYLSVNGADPTIIDEAAVFFVTVIGNKLFYIDGDNKLFVYDPETDSLTEIMSRVDTIVPTLPLDLYKAIYQ